MKGKQVGIKTSLGCKGEAVDLPYFCAAQWCREVLQREGKHLVVKRTEIVASVKGCKQKERFTTDFRYPIIIRLLLTLSLSPFDSP